MPKVNHNTLRHLIKRHIETGTSLMVRGEPGVGKTEMIFQVAAEEAKRLDRKLVVWNELTTADKESFYYDIDKRKATYFLSVVDLLSKLPEDISGLPKSKEDFIQWLPDLQFWMLSQPEVHGIAFFDELLQAQQAIQKPVAGAFLNKLMGTLKLSDNVNVFAASNRKEDKCGIIEMLEHLKNRMGHVELLTPTAKEWAENWAAPNDIDPRIISFVMFKPDHLYQHLDMRKSDSFPTPRSWAMLSKFTKSIKSETEADINELELMAQVRIGDGTGSLFSSFIKLRNRIDCEDIIAHPEKVEKLPLDLKLAFCSWAVENLGRKGYLAKVLKVVQFLRKDDLALLVMSMTKSKCGKAPLRVEMEKKENEHLFDLYKFLEGT